MVGDGMSSSSSSREFGLVISRGGLAWPEATLDFCPFLVAT